MTIAQIDPLNVEVVVPVSEYGTIKKGMRAEVRPEYPVGGVYTGKVTIVDRVVNAASGSFGVRVELPNANLAIPSGLKCNVRFKARDVPKAQRVAARPSSAHASVQEATAFHAQAPVGASPRSLYYFFRPVMMWNGVSSRSVAVATSARPSAFSRLSYHDESRKERKKSRKGSAEKEMSHSSDSSGDLSKMSTHAAGFERFHGP